MQTPILERDSPEFERLLELRKEGWSYVELAGEFGIYKGTAMKYCIEAGVHIVKKRSQRINYTENMSFKRVPFMPLEVKNKKERYIHLVVVDKGKGKSYNEYVRQERKRIEERRLKSIL